MDMRDVYVHTLVMRGFEACVWGSADVVLHTQGRWGGVVHQVVAPGALVVLHTSTVDCRYCYFYYSYYFGHTNLHSGAIVYIYYLYYTNSSHDDQRNSIQCCIFISVCTNN